LIGGGLQANVGAMNARLHDLIVETFVVTWTTDVDFTPEEMARLREIDAEPFEAADRAEVEAFFRRRG
jgi:hypothetical protein